MKRRFRRQPFILLSFSSSEKLRKAQEAQSYQRIQCIGHTDFNTSGTNGPRAETGAFSPSATAGLCVASEIAPITTFATLDSATLLYTYISRFSENPHYQQQLYLRPSFIPIFNFSHKRPTFAFTSESGYTLGFRRRIAHKGLHAETGAVSDGGAITTLGAFHTFRKPCVARCQNGKLCRFWVLVGGTPEGRREPAGQRCAYARRCPAGVAAPLGCVIFLLLSKLRLVHPALRAFPRVRDEGWYHHSWCALRVAETLDGRLSKGFICRFLRLGSLH